MSEILNYIEHSIEIMLQNPEQHRQSEIDGLVFGHGCSREQARRMIDGETPLTQEEE